MDKQRSTKHTHKAKDRVTQITLKTGVNSGAPEEKAVPAPLVLPGMLIKFIIFEGLQVLNV